VPEPTRAHSRPMSTRIVLRNAGLLMLAQILAAPLSVLMNAVAARKLGTEDFGLLYQAATFGAFAFLFVEWGQGSVLTAKVAGSRASAGSYLGSSIAFRLAASIIIGLLTCGVCAAAGYAPRFIGILSLAMVGLTCATVVAACQDVMRGFERAELAAGSFVAWQLASVLVVLPVLLLGGGIYGFLSTQIGCALAGCVFVLLLLPRLQVPRLEVHWGAVRELFMTGRSFLIFNMVLALQPLIDAALLAKLAPLPAGDMGWFAVARKLVGFIIFPASALIGALYPTLCRLRIESMDAFRRTMADALYAVAVLVIPATVGCLYFPELGVAIFGNAGYGPAADDVRMYAPYIALVYFSMPIGACIASIGRQNAWTTVQFGSVLVSLILDPPLILWFQRHSGNGGLGVCLAGAISEVLMVTGGALLLPAGIAAALAWRKLAAVLLSGGVMAALAYATSGIPPVLRALIATLGYLVCLQLSGGFNFLKTRAFLREIRGH
jgi:O-antigen/teichoic acid export membrane protein